MMNKWILAICIAVGAAMTIGDADAKRLGGSRSIGAQRSVTAPPASTPARPAQSGQAQQAAPQQGAPAPQPAQSGFSRWLPMLGGLALGGLLGSLFGGSGLGGVLLIALLAVVAVFAFRALAGRREQEAPQPLQMAGGHSERVATPMPVPAAAPSAIGTANIPAGFDTAGFLRAAKTNFIKLQVANDLGRLEEIRELTTQEMYDELRKEMLGRGSAAQQTDVESLDADLLEVATERAEHWASVRFSGTVRENRGAAPESFEEVWNLVKPADGSSGWLLAGIQQMH